MELHLAIKFITNTASPGEHRQFQSWLDSDNRNREEYNRFSSLWEEIGAACSDSTVDIEKAWIKVKVLTIDTEEVPVIQKPGFRRRWYLTGIASAILLFVALGIAFLDKSGKLSVIVHSTVTYHSYDSICEVKLTDGSTVILNAYSELKTSKAFRGKYRKVWLTGEAWFEVKSNPMQPFLIRAGKTFTEVPGTAFNLRAFPEEDQIIVTVNTGQVYFYKASGSSEKLSLLPGERGMYHLSAKELSKEENSDPNVTAWKTGNLYFENTPLTEVIRLLEKLYHVSIVSDSRLAATYLFTGKFENVPLSEALEILELTLDIEFMKTGERLIISFN